MPQLLFTVISLTTDFPFPDLVIQGLAMELKDQKTFEEAGTKLVL